LADPNLEVVGCIPTDANGIQLHGKSELYITIENLGCMSSCESFELLHWEQHGVTSLSRVDIQILNVEL